MEWGRESVQKLRRFLTAAPGVHSMNFWLNLLETSLVIIYLHTVTTFTYTTSHRFFFIIDSLIWLQFSDELKLFHGYCVMNSMYPIGKVMVDKK